VRDGTILAAMAGCLAALVAWFVNTMR